MVVLFGTEAKEVYNRARKLDSTCALSGVFECFDMGGAYYKAFKRISGELFTVEFGTFNEAVRFINSNEVIA